MGPMKKILSLSWRFVASRSSAPSPPQRPGRAICRAQPRGGARRATDGGAAASDGHHGDSRTRYESTRLQSFSEWWQMPLLVGVCALVIGFVGYMYRRDSVELKPGVRRVVGAVAIGGLCGLLLMYLDIERRSEVKVIHNSRVVMLVDTSLSMSRIDADDSGSASARARQRRIEQVTGPLADGELLKSLRKNARCRGGEV